MKSLIKTQKYIETVVNSILLRTISLVHRFNHTRKQNKAILIKGSVLDVYNHPSYSEKQAATIAMAHEAYAVKLEAIAETRDATIAKVLA